MHCMLTFSRNTPSIFLTCTKTKMSFDKIFITCCAGSCHFDSEYNFALFTLLVTTSREAIHAKFVKIKKLFLVMSRITFCRLSFVCNPDIGWKVPWWCHQMDTFSTLLAIGAGNSPVTGEFPSQRPVTRGFDVFFHLCLNKQLNKQPWHWWSETPLGSLWRHCNAEGFKYANVIWTKGHEINIRRNTQASYGRIIGAVKLYRKLFS